MSTPQPVTWRGADQVKRGGLKGEDHAGRQIREVTGICGVMARTLGVGEVIDPGLQREVVQVRKQRVAGVPPVIACKVVQVNVRGRAGDEGNPRKPLRSEDNGPRG